jgi:hypothetical protein
MNSVEGVRDQLPHFTPCRRSVDMCYYEGAIRFPASKPDSRGIVVTGKFSSGLALDCAFLSRAFPRSQRGTWGRIRHISTGRALTS